MSLDLDRLEKLAREASEGVTQYYPQIEGPIILKLIELARWGLEAKKALEFIAELSKPLDAYDFLASKLCVDLPSEVEVRDYFQWSKDVKVTTPLQALEVMDWLRSRIKIRTVEEVDETERQLTDKLAEALKWERNRCGVLTGPLKDALEEYEKARGE